MSTPAQKSQSPVTTTTATLPAWAAEHPAVVVFAETHPDYITDLHEADRVRSTSWQMELIDEAYFAADDEAQEWGWSITDQGRRALAAALDHAR